MWFTNGKKDSKEDDPPYGIFIRIIENLILFAAACYLLRLGISWLISVRVPLLVVAISLVIIVIFFRTYRWNRWRRHHDDY